MSLVVALDFDGVLNTYDGWVNEDELFMPRKGVGLFLAKLDSCYDVVVYTIRDVDKVRDWLVEYNLSVYVKYVTNTKPRAFVYVDDRGLKFEGDYDETLRRINSFKTHWEQVNIEYVDSN